MVELAILVSLAAVLGVGARLLRQPLILAYLLTGALIGYFGFFNAASGGTLRAFADLGVMFLLFLVGLEINYSSLRMVGKTSLILGVVQVLISSALGFGLAHALGFARLSSLYLGLAMSFASTIIVVKFLSEKRDIGSLYGKLSVGLLLVQDVVAVFALVLLGGVGEAGSFGATPIWWSLSISFLKGAFLFGIMLWLGRNVLPKIFDRVARVPELLFLLSLAWVFVVAALVSRVGFSVEIAGLLAGLALANSAEHFQIAGRIRSLRDFFIVIFFVLLGSSLAITNFGEVWLPVIAFSLFVLIVNPLVVLGVLGLLGYRRRTSFFAGLMVTQISEFSLVLMALGVRQGHVGSDTASIAAAVAVITIIVSSYAITHADAFFKQIRRALRFFERAHPKENGGGEGRFEKPFILIGANRVGESIARHLPKEDLLVIEFDPDVAARLTKQGIDHIFGDITDPEVFERANFEAARLVISTSPDLQDNLHLLETLNLSTRRPRVIVRAEDEREADMLYEAGADYVLLPHVTSGQYLGKTLAVDPEMNVLEGLRASDMEMMGHKSP